MAEDIQNLIIAVNQRGLASVERAFQNLDGQIQNTLQHVRDNNLAIEKSSKVTQDALRRTSMSVSDFESALAGMDKGLKTTFDGKRISGFSKNLRALQREMRDIETVMITEAAKGNDALSNSAKKRLKTLQGMVDKEMASFSRLYKKHREEFDELAKMKKSTFGEGALNFGQGSANLLRQLQQKDFAGAAGTVGRGGQAAFQGTRKRAFDAAMSGSAGGARLASGMASLAKLAGPLAIIAGTVATLFKAFLDLDSQIKDINKSMLKSVPITSLASNAYGDYRDQIVDGEEALRSFRNTVMTDASLRMLGLTPEEMGGLMTTLEQTSGMLSTLRQDGDSTKRVLEQAQIAALNLGVDASDTMSLIGTLADVTGASFGEAVDSLSMIIQGAQDAGVSTQKFFNVVQGVVGEMGLYNFRLEETAALFSKLTTIMDSKSAEQFATSLAGAIKNASAQDRTRMAMIAGSGTMRSMANRAMGSAERGVDMGLIRRQMEAMGLGGFQSGNLAGTMSGMSQRERQALMSAVSDANQGQGERLRKFENIRTSRGSVERLQGIMGDFSQFDQAALQIGNLEKVLGQPLSQMNSLFTEALGVNEDQLRMLKTLKAEGEGDLARLQMLLEKGTGGNAFQEAAKQMGYIVSEENGKILDQQGNEIKSFNDLLSTMDDQKAADLQEKQKTVAEKQADLQRSLLDEVKYKLMDLVQGIYRTILDIYDAMINSKFFGGDENTQARSKVLKEEFVLRDQLRKKDKAIDEARKSGDTATLRKLQAERGQISDKLKGKERLRGLLNQNTGLNMAAATALSRDDTLAGGVRFDYGGAGGRSFTEREFKGMSMGNAKLSRIVTGSGQVIEGDKALKAFIEEQGKNQEAAGEVVGQVIAQHMEAEGILWPDEAQKITKETNAILSDKGIQISDKALDKLVQKQVSAQLYTQAIDDLVSLTGRSPVEAQNLLDRFQRGDPEAMAQWQKEDKFRFITSNYGIEPMVQKARDVKMVTGGIPFLDLQPGDIIVDQESLANTLVGGKGQFVPDLLRGASGGSGGAGGSSTKTLNANFYIYGGDAGEMRRQVLSVLDEWERAKVS